MYFAGCGPGLDPSLEGLGWAWAGPSENVSIFYAIIDIIYNALISRLQIIPACHISIYNWHEMGVKFNFFLSSGNYEE